MVVLTVGRVYLVHIIDGFAEINRVSPLPQIIPESDGWRVVKAPPTLRAIRRLASTRVHVAIAARVDRVNGFAVILLGSGNPYHPQRFIPWEGTKRLRFQTTEKLRPTPTGAFLEFPGHINFTHAVLVKVVTPLDVIDPNENPGSAIFDRLTDEVDDLSDIISVPSESLLLLQRLHSFYWNGIRYAEDGSLIYPPEETDGTDGSRGGREMDHASGDGEVDDRSRDGEAGPSGPSSGSGPEPAGVGPGPSPDTPSTLATRLAALIHRAEMRAEQLQLLDFEQDIFQETEISLRKAVRVQIAPLTSNFRDIIEPLQ